MDSVPPDSKRLRLSSWSASSSTPQPAPSLPPPHSTPTQLPLPNPSPHFLPSHPHSHSPSHHHLQHQHQHQHHQPHHPPSQQPGPHHHPGPPPPPPLGHPSHTTPAPHLPALNTYQPFYSRPHDHSSAPPTPASAPPAPLAGPPSDGDRRHHDSEPYAPMQDHYRQQQQPAHHPPPPLPQHHASHHPSPSSVHLNYHSYPSRDSLVKREQAEDLRRPSSTGHTSDSLPPTPHALATSLPPPQPPQPHPGYADHQQRPMSYDNAHSVPPTPAAYRAPSYPPPPTPVSHQTPYEQQSGFSTGPDSFYGVYSAPSKKKNTRASQACDQCRQLKAKCDETKPCKTCRDKGTVCHYRDPVPKATDKAQADILDAIASMQESLTTLADNVGNVHRRLLKMESNTGGPEGTPVKQDPLVEDEVKSQPAAFQSQNVDTMNSHYSHDPSQNLMSYTTNNDASMSMGNSASGNMDGNMDNNMNNNMSNNMGNGMSNDMGSSMGNNMNHDMDNDMSNNNANNSNMGSSMMDDEMETEPGLPVPPGEPAIPINHTTLNSLLLEWPAIRDLTRAHVEAQGIKYPSEYPIILEQNRGALLVYGRGEDSHSMRRSKEVPDHGSIEMPDDSSDLTSSPSPAADFGQLGGLSPPDQVEYHGGVLLPDGSPDFSEAKVQAYVESFKDNILNMHPIIMPEDLDMWVRQFLDQLPATHPRPAKNQPAKSSFAVGSTAGVQPPIEPTGSKRKRSPVPDGPEGPSTPGPSRSGRPHRSMLNATVLTVLALGKICMYRDGVPDFVGPREDPHGNSASQGSPLPRNGILPSPGQGSPPNYSAHSHSSGLPSPKEQDRATQSRRSSIHGSGSGSGSARSGFNLKKNYDSIPGLEYFAYATDIIGNYCGGYNSLKAVYANIFAGLYHGQLARPVESFAYIHKASHVLQVILRPHLDKLRQMKRNNTLPRDKRANEYALAFWTCLQLESDLIAELPLPPSGLLSYEDDMPHPDMTKVKGFEQRILDSYPGQLYLRTHLNSIHRMFYAPEDPGKPIQDKFKNVHLVADSVQPMEWIAPRYAFKETDSPAQDILSARLRAKYWGAQGITYRPFIRQILQFTHSMEHPASPNPQAVSEFREGIIAPVIDPKAKSIKDIDPAVVDLARKGVKALVESTRAFHGLGKPRPIITNVFGTAHAQWGNLLILSAVYKNNVLGKFVTEDLLRDLFQKTIAFLRQSSTSTNSLRTDMLILEGLQRDLFSSSAAMAPTSSFSSMASASTPIATTATPHPGSSCHTPTQTQMGPPHMQN